MSGPIPVAVIDNDNWLPGVLKEELLPDFDVVQVCTQPTIVATQFLKASTAGRLNGSNLEFGIGSNSELPEDERKAPRAIIIAPSIPTEHAIEVEMTFNFLAQDPIVVERMKPGDEPKTSASKLRDRLNELVKDGTLKRE